ncbi:unnamed protein product [Rotaria sp. Silwood2]|nr:unnamed protein product [Rotaria sp. Silwood2]CAF4218386.1 unnamed protein product [Rotaria sp. Silwood2]
MSYIGLNAITHDRPFDGLIDRISITFFVKNSSEILDEATLLTNYKFDVGNLNVDSGPITIEAMSHNVYKSLSDNRSCALFNSSDSYFQTTGFTLLNSHQYELSITFWLRLNIIAPLNDINVIAILQLTSLIDGQLSSSYACVFGLVVFPKNSTVGIHFPAVSPRIINVNNWIIENNTWVHLGIAYDGQDTFYFYKNGQLIGNNTQQQYSTVILDDPRLALAIGGVYFNDSDAQNSEIFKKMTCFAKASSFNYSTMDGEIDELMMFGRLLTQSEFVDLAHSQY